MIYADTSFIVSLYGQDAGSAKARKAVKTFSSPIPYTWLNRIETRNAMRLAVFRKEISEAQCRALLSTIDADLRNGVLKDMALNIGDLLEETERLSVKYSTRTGNRIMDIMHVAGARVLKAETFITFDRRQKSLAAKTGLKVY